MRALQTGREAGLTEAIERERTRGTGERTGAVGEEEARLTGSAHASISRALTAMGHCVAFPAHTASTLEVAIGTVATAGAFRRPEEARKTGCTIGGTPSAGETIGRRVTGSAHSTLAIVALWTSKSAGGVREVVRRDALSAGGSRSLTLAAVSNS